MPSATLSVPIKRSIAQAGTTGELAGGLHPAIQERGPCYLARQPAP